MNEDNKSAGGRRNAGRKEKYKSPTLFQYGSIDELTGSGTGDPEMGAQAANKMSLVD